MRYLAIITLTIMTLALMACSGGAQESPPSPQADTPTQRESISPPVSQDGPGRVGDAPEAAAEERADEQTGEILTPDNGVAGKNDGTADGPAIGMSGKRQTRRGRNHHDGHPGRGRRRRRDDEKQAKRPSPDARENRHTAGPGLEAQA